MSLRERSTKEEGIPSGNPRMNRNQQRAFANHAREQGEGEWASAKEWEFRDPKPKGPKPRSQGWKGKKKESEHKQDATAAISFRSVTETAPTDEPLYDIGPHGASLANNEIYAQNFEMTGYVDQCVETFEVLRGLNTRLDREMPYSMFLHSMATIANCYLLDVTTDNGERKMGNVGKAQDYLPEDLCMPDNLYNLLTNIGNTNTASGDDVRFNLPEVAVPSCPIEEPHPLPSGSFGECNAANHNAYECYISPLVTANRVIASRNGQVVWQPLPAASVPAGAQPTGNLLGYGPIDHVPPDAVPRINGFQFPDDDTIQGRLKICPELMSRVNNVLFNLRDKYKMRDVGMQTDRTRNYIKPKLIPANHQYCYLATGNVQTIVSQQNCQIKSSASFGSSSACQSNVNGSRRKRSDVAPGTCYIVNGAAPAGWVDTRNSNYEMIGDFAPTLGADDPSLRVDKFTSYAPGGSRRITLQSYLKKNYVVK